MRKICFIAMFLSIVSAWSSNITIEGEYSYIYSDSESIVDAKRTGFDLAKKDALEKFATYISSESVVKDYITEKEEIISSTLGIMKNIQVVEEVIDKANNSVYYKVSAEVDEDEILNALKQKYGSAEIKIRVNDFVESGIRAEKEIRIGEALRYYYWALLILKSDPAGNSLRNEEFDSRILTIALPEKINKIFSNINMEIKDIIESQNYKNIQIEAKYQNKPVSNLDFKFYNGEEWSRFVKVHNGCANVELYGDAANIVSTLLINIEYKYEDLCQHEESIKTALCNTEHVPFSSSAVKLKIVAKPKEPVIEEPKMIVEEKKQPTNAAERLAQRQREMQQKEQKPAVDNTPRKTVDQQIVKKSEQPYGMKTAKKTRTEFNLYFIFSVATGDFGSNSADYDYIEDAVKNELWTQGFAKAGFGLGYMAEVPFGESGFNFVTDFAIIFSPVDDTSFKEWADHYGFYNYEIGSWMNMPVLLGLMYKGNVTEKVSLYGYFTAGINMAIGPTFYFEWYDAYEGQNYYWEYTDPIPTITPAFSFGVGTSYGMFDYGLKYFMLGKSEIDYTSHFGSTLTMEREISMLVFHLGLRFGK